MKLLKDTMLEFVVEHRILQYVIKSGVDLDAVSLSKTTVPCKRYKQTEDLGAGVYLLHQNHSPPHGRNNFSP